jgi:hypothetical protein
VDLYQVKDADAFYEDMKSASVDSKEPHDTDYRMREIPHSDPNNNLVLSALATR